MTTPLVHIPDRFNAASFFVDRNIAEGRGDKIAFFHEDRAVTYRQLQEMVNRVGNALLDHGVEAEQRVLLILMDCPEFVASFFGAIKIGAVPVPVNTMMRAEDYLYFLTDSRARAAIIAEPLLAEVGRILGRAKHLKQVIFLGRAGGGKPVPRGEVGTLRVKGDSTMAYYWNLHEKTKETLFGPWIVTGDKFYEDEEGYFWYCGRSDDMLKVGGMGVSPPGGENALVA